MDDIRFTQSFTEEYYRLYNLLLPVRFQPALTTLTRTLAVLLDSKLQPSQRMRVRVEDGRIKSANRLLLKAQLSKYENRISKPSDIFGTIRDVVGTRVT
jgi:hypothetical protein